MAGRTGHVYSRSRDRIVSRGPRAVPPAWREQRKERVVSESRVFRSYETRVSSDALPAGMKYTMEDSQGGTIFVENLPPGTTSNDLLEFFSAIGPVDEYYMIHNDKGISKNMAIIQFRDITYAYKARNQLHGVAVDRTWPLRVRVVLDANGPLSALIPITSNSNTQPISDISPGPSSSSKPTTDNRRRATTPTGPRKKSDAKPQPSLSLLDRIAPLPLAARVNGFDPPTCPARDRNLSYSSGTRPIGRASIRAALKKGPKRTAKRNARWLLANDSANKWVQSKKTREELDAEMDEWRLAGVGLEAEETIARVTASVSG